MDSTASSFRLIPRHTPISHHETKVNGDSRGIFRVYKPEQPSRDGFSWKREKAKEIEWDYPPWQRYFAISQQLFALYFQVLFLKILQIWKFNDTFTLLGYFWALKSTGNQNNKNMLISKPNRNSTEHLSWVTFDFSSGKTHKNTRSYENIIFRRHAF